MGKDYTEEKATQLIEQVDTTKSGQISFEDFVQQFHSGQAKLMRHLNSRNMTSEKVVMEIAKNEFEKIPALSSTLSQRESRYNADNLNAKSKHIKEQTNSLRI